jgi:phytoene dehydrogenase-like protein
MAIQEHKRMDKSIIIIGGGLTGLSAGCYGRMNGYRTTIFEMHSLAGGVATAWKRKGYTIDGAMNWLMGTNPQSSLYRIWEELGAAPGWKVHNHEVNAIFENREGRAFTVYCDADRFEEYLLELAPEDAAVIQELTRMIRCLDIDFPAGKPGELQTIFDKLAMIKMLPVGRLMRRLRNVTANSFARRFRNPFVREMFGEALGSSFPLAMALMQLAIQHRKAAGYVIGGALALVEPIQKRYRSLGGELRFNARVQKILVENDRAVGVRLADGTEHRADWVVSTADGRTTIFDMLEGRYLDDALKRRYENPRLFAPLVYVALGVNRKLDVVPSIGGTAYPLDRPLVVAGKENRILNLRVYNFDPTLSPPGKDVAVVQYETDYDYWSKLRQDPQAYQVEKERICESGRRHAHSRRIRQPHDPAHLQEGQKEVHSRQALTLRWAGAGGGKHVAAKLEDIRDLDPENVRSGSRQPGLPGPIQAPALCAIHFLLLQPGRRARGPASDAGRVGRAGSRRQSLLQRSG